MPETKILGDWADLEEAWDAYTQMEATGWNFLPYSGGLFDQPELLMRNVYRIAAITRKTRDQQHAT
jgi:hypothetical protein